MAPLVKTLPRLAPAAILLLPVCLLFVTNASVSTRIGWALFSMVAFSSWGALFGATSLRFPWIALLALAAASFLCPAALGMNGSTTIALATVAATWGAFILAIAWSLRRFGAGISAVAAFLVLFAGFSAPVSAMPLVHATTGNPWQPRIVTTIAHACPFFPALAAIRPQFSIQWQTLPGMYAWSGLGHEIPLELPNPWLGAGIYLGLACLFTLAGFTLRPAHRK